MGIGGISVMTNFMEQAYAQALIAKDKGEVPIGAILVYDNNVIAKAHNQTQADGHFLSHAEMLVLLQGAHFLKTPYLSDVDLYVTLEPCDMCMGAISLSRIRRVYFGCYSDFLKKQRSTPCMGGFLESKCYDLLQGFFEDLRKNT